ncbi:MAG: hypothetical protein Fur0041_10920 [Bacteroidia bacterium]
MKKFLQQQFPVFYQEKADFKIVIILIWCALGLAIIRYIGDPFFVTSVLSDWGMKDAAHSMRNYMDQGPDSELHRLSWWVWTIISVYLIIPILIIRFVFNEAVASYGLKLKGAFHQWKIYALMLMIMLPLVAWFSTTPSFQARYPFYKLAHGEALWPNFWIWELEYFIQFLALEFFFRGFMVLGMREKLGIYSVFIMTVPYCMIHFGKPFPETIGAIVAGVILGAMSFQTRSVIMGVMIHYSVAITMDMFSLWQKGLL